MALRAVLRRIPGRALLLPSGLRMGHVHGLSPAAAARSMVTKSQGGPTTAAELHQNPASLLDEINLRLNSIDKRWDVLDKRARLRLAEHKRSVDNLEKIGDAATAVAVAIPVLLICGSYYKAK